MSTCALVGASDFNAGHFAAQHFDCVIAADRGYASLVEAGFEPDIVVGDFDSLGYVPQGENVERFPSEKDESDMELAVRRAYEAGHDTLLFYGALAGRLDHTIANLQLMVGCARRGLRVAGIGGEFAVAVLDGRGARRVRFSAFDPVILDDGEYGRFVSVFACGGTARDVVETGLKYSLGGAELPDDASQGLSNEFTGEAAAIAIGSGNAIVTFSCGAWPYLVR